MATGKYTLVEWRDYAFALGYRNKSGGKISRSRWHDVFHNRFYLGKTAWGRNGGEKHDGNHSALTDPATFAKVQEVLAKHDHYKKEPSGINICSKAYYILLMPVVPVWYQPSRASE